MSSETQVLKDSDVVEERKIKMITRIIDGLYDTYYVRAVFEGDDYSFKYVEIRRYKLFDGVKEITISRYITDEGLPKYFIMRRDAKDYKMCHTNKILDIEYIDEKKTLETLADPETYRKVEDVKNIEEILNIICKALSEQNIPCEGIYSILKE
jgi:hypothetical protein